MAHEIEIRQDPDVPMHHTVWRGNAQLWPGPLPADLAHSLAEKARTPDEGVTLIESDGYRREIVRAPTPRSERRQRRPKPPVPLSRGRRSSV